MEEEETIEPLDTTTPEYQQLDPIEFFSSKGLTFDSQINLFYCKKCDIHIINQSKTGFTDENLSNHLRQAKHKKKVDCRLGLEKFKTMDIYQPFDSRLVFHGMDSVKNLKVIQVPFKCGDCEFYGMSMTGVKKHSEREHGGSDVIQGVFECQRVYHNSGLVKVNLPPLVLKKTKSVKRVMEETRNVVRESKSKRVCARGDGNQENVEVMDYEGEEEGEDDFEEFIKSRGTGE